MTNERFLKKLLAIIIKQKIRDKSFFHEIDKNFEGPTYMESLIVDELIQAIFSEVGFSKSKLVNDEEDYESQFYDKLHGFDYTEDKSEKEIEVHTEMLCSFIIETHQKIEK